VLVLVAVALAVKIAGPVVAAAGELLRVALIVTGVILGAGVLGLVALIAVRVRHRAAISTRAVQPLPPWAQREVAARTGEPCFRGSRPLMAAIPVAVE
jgi:hypothetical protein